ncbi:MAG TPA: hypothetical protein VH539_22280 [Gemmatimonadaceae bacterium]
MSSTTLQLIHDGAAPPQPPSDPPDEEFVSEWSTRTVHSTINFGSKGEDGVFVPRELQGELEVNNDGSHASLRVLFGTLEGDKHIECDATVELPAVAMEQFGRLADRLLKNAKRDGVFFDVPPAVG